MNSFIWRKCSFLFGLACFVASCNKPSEFQHQTSGPITKEQIKKRTDSDELWANTVIRIALEGASTPKEKNEPHQNWKRFRTQYEKFKSPMRELIIPNLYGLTEPSWLT
ncbi:MAG TPA: hypothetical protein VFZ59_12015 [Verrucomicrobiae bacterium]|nr:hypothetical protein [Verrucomicrobiae bacterium]